MFPDFDHTRIVADPFKTESPPHSSLASPKIYRQDSRGAHELDTPTDDGSSEGHLPRNESFGNLGDIGLFATRPPSRSRSRSNSSGGFAGSTRVPLKGFSTLNSKEGFDEVTKKIRGAMAERGKERSRKRAEAEGGWELAGSGESGVATPGSDEGKKHI